MFLRVLKEQTQNAQEMFKKVPTKISAFAGDYNDSKDKDSKDSKDIEERKTKRRKKNCISSLKYRKKKEAELQKLKEENEKLKDKLSEVRKFFTNLFAKAKKLEEVLQQAINPVNPKNTTTRTTNVNEVCEKKQNGACEEKQHKNTKSMIPSQMEYTIFRHGRKKIGCVPSFAQPDAAIFPPDQGNPVQNCTKIHRPVESSVESSPRPVPIRSFTLSNFFENEKGENVDSTPFLKIGDTLMT